MNKLKSRKRIDLDEYNDMINQLRSQESVSTSSIPVQDEKPFPMPKIKSVSDITFSERPFQTPLSSRKDQYDDKSKEPSKMSKPSKSLKPQGVGTGEWARYAIELINIESEKENINYLESKLRDMDLSSKEVLETINQIEKIKNRIPKLEQESREYYEDLIRRDREYSMSRK